MKGGAQRGPGGHGTQAGRLLHGACRCSALRFSFSAAPVKPRPCLAVRPVPPWLPRPRALLHGGWGAGTLATNAPSRSIPPQRPPLLRRNSRRGWGARERAHIYLRSFQAKTSISPYCISPPNLITLLSRCKSASPSASVLLKPGRNWWSDMYNFPLGFAITGSYKPITGAELVGGAGWSGEPRGPRAGNQGRVK